MRWLAFSFLLGGCGPAELAEVCDNDLDDDLDGLEDCADSDCLGACSELCGDRLDNDGDAAIDCVDTDCDGKCGETCDDGRDNDLDGLVDCDDENCNQVFCAEVCNDARDNDLDGRIDCDDDACFGPDCAELCGDGDDNDGDGAADCLDLDCLGGCPEDCGDGLDNDGDALVDCGDTQDCRGAVTCPEVCDDGQDNDGDLFIDCGDANCESYCDADGDGYQADVHGGLDCDDSDPQVNPLGIEVCDGIDNDCDALTDQDDASLDPTTLTAFYPDNDNDNWGRPGPITKLCVDAPDLAPNDDDCNDNQALTFPTNTEVCDGVDNDCDVLVDDTDPTLDLAQTPSWYTDSDGDGWGGDAFVDQACAQPAGTADNSDDCDDADPDGEVVSDWLTDGDGDGYGAGAPFGAASCSAPAPTGYAEAWKGEDCDDSTAAVSPEAQEDCGDAIDNDCDGGTDECIHGTIGFVGLNLADGCLYDNSGDYRWDNLGSLTFEACAEAASARKAQFMSGEKSVPGGWFGHRNGSVAMTADYPSYLTTNVISNDTCVVGRDPNALVDNLPLANRTLAEGRVWAWEDFGLQYYDVCQTLASEHGGSIITPWTIGRGAVVEYWVKAANECAAYNWILTSGTTWGTSVVAAGVRSGQKACMVGYIDL